MYLEHFALSFPQIDPVALQVGPIAIRWYGLAYLVGILLGWRYGRQLIANANLWPDDTGYGSGNGGARLAPVHFDDLLIWATIGIVAGGRIGFVLFYQPGVYLSDPLAALRIWEGGMSFHGGFLGFVLATILFARSRAVSALSLLDVAAASVPFGLFFGRLANFINGELWGRVSDVPWAMVFPGAGFQPRHPSQLYEAALEGILLFIFLRILTHAFGSLKMPGMTGGAFVAGYGMARFFVEFFRQPDEQLGFIYGFLTMGMILSLPMIVVGLAAVIWAKRESPGEYRGG